MARSEKYTKWLETGHKLFAEEGVEGLQVEKMARILNLNKSGFYHYFGDMEYFCERLITYHEQLLDIYIHEIANCQSLDPDYLNQLLNNKILVFAQMQLVRYKSHPWFEHAPADFGERIGHGLLDIWSRHISIKNNPELSFQFFGMMRDMFYLRLEWNNYNFAVLKSISDEIYDTAQKFLSEKERLEGGKKI